MLMRQKILKAEILKAEILKDRNTYKTEILTRQKCLQDRKYM